LQEKIKKGESSPNLKINLDRTYNPVKNINITINDTTISIENDGDGIDVCYHNEEKCYIPELIFCNLLTSGNYDNDEERKVGGQYGLGSKLCNIFSKEFIVETVDSYRKLKYVQVTKDNMSVIEPPIITKCNGKSYTKITYTADFSRFGLINYTSDDTVKLLKKRIYDIAATSHIGGNAKINVTLNGKLIKVKSFEKYIDMFIGNKGESKRLYIHLNDDWEIAVASVTQDIQGGSQI
jgi:DNA topoisomerase-2